MSIGGAAVEVVCLGETMALIAPDPPAPLATAKYLVLTHAGAESNVAVSLARLGTSVQWCSRLGDDPFGHRILAEITAAGVDTTAVQLCPDARTGVFFKNPDGASTSVLYYRDGSAASAMDETDADRALAKAPRLLHLSGITPALSASCARAVEHAVDSAHRLGVEVSLDVNHRAAVWPDRATAARELHRLAQRCDIVLVGLDEAATLWDTDTDVSVRALLDRPRVLVVKDGAREASSFEDGRHTQVPAMTVEVIEAVGAGDGFAAGWLHARLRGMAPVEALRLGHLVAAGSLSSATDHSVSPIAADALRAAARRDEQWPPHRWPPHSWPPDFGSQQ